MKGRRFDAITIAVGGMTLTLKEVFFSGLQIGQEHATVSLDFGSSEMDTKPPPQGSERDS